MPKIQFSNLPRPVWRHLLQRANERRISVSDLMARQEWVKTARLDRRAWYKDFGSFMLCGTDQFPKTVLEKGMKPFGARID